MRRIALPLLLLAAAGAGCRSSATADIATLTSNSDQVIWEAGEKAFADKQWEVARQHYRRIIDGFPQSSLGPPARIALADSHFREGGTANFVLAVSGYRDFLTLFPSHPRSDYAQFMAGEAFFKQRGGADRDQTQTREALDEYLKLLDLHPDSPHVETARQRIAQCRHSLARAEFLVGFFYQRTRRTCRAAIPRYEGVLRQFPDYSGTDEVLYRLSDCLIQTQRPAEALPHLARLLEEYGEGPWAEPARSLQARVGVAAPAPADPAPPELK